MEGLRIFVRIFVTNKKDPVVSSEVPQNIKTGQGYKHACSVFKFVFLNAKKGRPLKSETGLA